MNEQKLSFTVIEFKLVLEHPLPNVADAGFQPQQRMGNLFWLSIITCQIELRIISIEVEECMVGVDDIPQG